MRLTELMELRSVDQKGDPLDHVSDVRLEKRDGDWVVTHVAVGRAAFAERLGFIHGVVERPAVLARVMSWVGRHARVVPWDQVTVEDDVLRVEARWTDLPRPEGRR